MQQQVYDELQEHFINLGHGGHYTDKQKEYAIEQWECGCTNSFKVTALRRLLLKWRLSIMSLVRKGYAFWVF